MQGMEWIILIVVVAVLLFGAKKIPELAKSIGRAKGEFEKGKQEVQDELRDSDNKTKTESAAKKKNRSTKKDDSKIVKAAKELGIETEGKSDKELKKEIELSVSSS